MTYMAGFGLASGAGAKAFIPVIALGAFHYTPYFELSGGFRWIADPVVMIVLGLLLVLEIIVDAHPDLGEYSDLVSYLPKAVAGFIGCAAMVGSVDENLTALAASGVLGAGTATGVHWIRNQIRRPFREVAETVHESAGTMASLSEAGLSAAVSGAAVVVPPVSALMAVMLGGTALVAAKMAGDRRTPCVHCSEPIRRGALVCIHCGRDQVGMDSRDA
jgi:hypothetical protein